MLGIRGAMVFFGDGEEGVGEYGGTQIEVIKIKSTCMLSDSGKQRET